MPSIIVSSINESAGKSAIAAAIISRLRRDGVAVKSVADTDALFIDDSGVEAISVAEIDSSDASAHHIIEGSSGNYEADLALADAIDAHVVIVVALDDDNVESTASKLGERLAGVIINKVPRYRNVHADQMVASLREAGIECFGWLPEDRRLAAGTIEAMINHLEGRLMFDAVHTAELVDNVLIGGLVLDWGPFYFRSQENTCVVVRTGRPDVQISALQSETTRALVLTGGGKPIDYVFYEARTKRIPLIIVDRDTNATMDAIDDMSPAVFSHPDKLARITQLLEERSLLDPIMDVLEQPPTR